MCNRNNLDFRLTLEDLIDPVAKLFNFHSSEMFVSPALREISRRGKENGLPCTGVREIEGAWGHVACSTGSERMSESEEGKEGERVSERMRE